MTGRGRALAAGVALAGLTLAAFWPVGSNGFISFDDPAYLTANPQVQAGLTLTGLRWAFTTFHAATWHPLTWLSHMADVELFGLQAGPHHLHSLVLHLLAALLFCASLSRMTGQIGASALAAALFAVHPLRVESVAWAAERKDVLAAFWWMLTLWLYAGYAARPSRGRLAGVAAGLTAGLLAKAMLVTLPFALLLLDGWPLGRLGSCRWRDLWPRVREKLPLFLLAAAAGGVALAAQGAGGAVVDWQSVSGGRRLANAAVAGALYLQKLVWPTGLAVLYPLAPEGPGTARTVGSAALICGLTALAAVGRRRAPYAAMGWLWFLGTLLPVIGLVQIGSHALADRFTYLPSAGLCAAAAWGGLALVRRGRRGRAAGAVLTAVAALAAGAALSALALSTQAQARRWSSSEALYRHALAVTRGNYVIHTNLGIELAQRGRREEALQHLDEAVRIRPDFALARNNRGNVLAALGRAAEALAEYRLAVELEPANPRARHNLGLALMGRQRWGEAAAHLERAVSLAPDYLSARQNLGIALAALGQYAEAAEQFRQVLRRAPEDGQARANLARLEQLRRAPASPR